jgi:hypothetical protein
MSLHSDTLFWFQTNISLLLLLKAAFVAKKQQIPSLVWRDKELNPRPYRTRGDHANHYTTDAV